MRRALSAILFAILSIQSSGAMASGPSADDFQRFLIPVKTPVDPGIVRWEANAWVFKDSPEFVRVTQFPGTPRECRFVCPDEPAAPGVTQFFGFLSQYPFGGGFVYVAAEGVENIHMTLRVEEWLTFPEQGYGGGMEVPIVSEEDVSPNETVHLIRIPCDDRFRRLLRVYSFDGVDTWARIRIVGAESQNILGEQMQELRRFRPGLEVEVSELFPPYPPYDKSASRRISVARSS